MTWQRGGSDVGKWPEEAEEKQRKTESLTKATVDEDAAGRGQQQQENTLTEVKVPGRRKQAGGVREEDWPAEAEKKNGGRTGKKKKRDRARLE